MKDRSAILMAGRRGDAAYGSRTPAVISSPAPITWMRRLRGSTTGTASAIADKFAGQTWNRLIDDAALYEKYTGKDAIEGERDRIDITFPHPIVAKPPQTQYYVELRRSPFAEEVLLDFALEAMKQHDLGRDADTDILAIGFAATDAIGHQWEPDSHEQMDQMLRLDRVCWGASSSRSSRLLVSITASWCCRPTTARVRSWRFCRCAACRGAASRRRRWRTRSSPRWRRNIRASPISSAISRPTCISTKMRCAVTTSTGKRWKRRPSRPWFQRASSKRCPRTTICEAPRAVPIRISNCSKKRSTLPRAPHLNVLLKPGVYVNSAVGGTGHGTAYDVDCHVPVVFMGRVSGRAIRRRAGPGKSRPRSRDLLRLEFLPRANRARLGNVH